MIYKRNSLLIGAPQSKINEAKEEAKRRAHTIDAQKASRTKGGMGMPGMSGGGMGSAAGMFEDERKVFARALLGDEPDEAA